MSRVSAAILAFSAALMLAGCGGGRGAPPPGGSADPNVGIPEDDDYGPIDPADPTAGPPRQKAEAAVPDDGRFSALSVLRKYGDVAKAPLTRAQVVAGLRADFAAADQNHNGVIDPAEMRAVNVARWRLQGSTASPLTDWNGDLVVDFYEYAGMALSLFDQVDADHDGVLTDKEIKPQPQRKSPPTREDTRGRRRGPNGP